MSTACDGRQKDSVVQAIMNALTLDATWSPRSGHQIGARQHETRKATNASAVWRSPRLVFNHAPIPRIEDDEVLIQVKACGVCGTDVHCCEQDNEGYVRFSGAAKLPVILGHEFAGKVVDAGSKVTDLKV